jgi:hypothetical protein
MCDASAMTKLRICQLDSAELVKRFNYVAGDRLIAVVQACNSVGCSAESKPNTKTTGQVGELKPFTLIGGRKGKWSVKKHSEPEWLEPEKSQKQNTTHYRKNLMASRHKVDDSAWSVKQESNCKQL